MTQDYGCSDVDKICNIKQILYGKRCKQSFIENIISIFEDDDMLHLNGTQKKVRIVKGKITKYSFYERYFARQHLKRIYNKTDSPQAKKQAKEILLDTGTKELVKKFFYK